MNNVRYKYLILNIIFTISLLAALIIFSFWQLYKHIPLDVNGVRMISSTNIVQTFAIYYVVLLTIIYKVIYFYRFNEIKRHLKSNEDLYKIIMSQRDDIIFQWNSLNDTVLFSENWKEKFSQAPITNNVRENIGIMINRVYEKDISTFNEIINSLKDSDIYKENELRIITSDGSFRWFRIRLTKVFDHKNNLIKVVGTIIDIDDEKKELEDLLYKSQVDGLTNLYNKNTIESIIKSEINNTHCALLVIDLDDFKIINDKSGHLKGDYVLKEVSNNLRKTFIDKCSIGRTGGDEFVVFFREVSNIKDIVKTVEVLIEKNRETFEKEDINVSCSIGIAESFGRRMSFEELFGNADKALYKAKEKGKNTYYILN